MNSSLRSVPLIGIALLLSSCSQLSRGDVPPSAVEPDDAALEREMRDDAMEEDVPAEPAELPKVEPPTPSEEWPPPPPPPPPPSPPAEVQAPTSRTINVNVSNWEFSPRTIRAKKGEKVTLRLNGVSGAHGFSIRGLNVNVPISQGQTKTVELPTDSPGTYTLFCSIVCGPGHSDMNGTVIIEE